MDNLQKIYGVITSIEKSEFGEKFDIVEGAIVEGKNSILVRIRYDLQMDNLKYLVKKINEENDVDIEFLGADDKNILEQSIEIIEAGEYLQGQFKLI